MNESNLNRMIREHKARIIWFLVFLILAVFVTALVFGTLKRSVQAQTYTKRVFACSYAQEGAEPVAHKHNDDCYENGELICTLPERELHIHGDECYAEEKVLVCTLEEGEGHVHTDACYTEEPVLVCGLEENDGHVHSVENGCYTRVQGDLICTDEDPEHVHTDECYAWEEVLTCEIPEGEGAHHHSEECYETQRVLSCGKEEGEGAHIHDETCYEIKKVLICDKEEVKTEHVHTVDCFQVVDMSPEEIHALHMSELPESDPDADVETPDVWENRFASVPLSGEWDRDLLKIAETQLGYTESQRNFDAVLDENGEGYTLKGWTRYGAWYGIPYGDWCAMFISFCLNYADIPESAVPYDCATTTWIDSLSERGMYAPAGSYDPKPGDLIFFDWEGDGLADHVGIVWAVNADSITTIEGNHTPSVELFDYALNDSHIQGYGILPENPELAAEKPEMPAQSFREVLGDMVVVAEADEGAFPAGTKMRVVPIDDEEVEEKVSSKPSSEVVKVQLVDITFVDADENEIEPLIPIRVTMTTNDTVEADNVEIIHVDDKGAVSTVETTDSVEQSETGAEASFEADSFSVYGFRYTVDVAYENSSWSFPGQGSYSIIEILRVLGIEPDEAGIEKVSLRLVKGEDHPGALYLSNVDGVDYLNSDIAFQDTYELKVKTGENYYLIEVTDVSFDMQAAVSSVTLNGQSGGTWTVKEGQEYTLHLSFEETPSVVQFPTSSNTITYQLPNNFKPTGSLTDVPFVLSYQEDGVYGTIQGCTFSVSESGLVTITLTDYAKEKIETSGDAKFNFDITGYFDQSNEETDFGGGNIINVIVDTSKDVSIHKTGSYNSNDNKVHYNVTVRADGSLTKVRVWDIISGTALSMDQGSLQYNGNSSTPKGGANANGFDMTFPSMQNGETINITYTASVNMALLGDGNGTVEQTGNTVHVKPDEKEEKTDEHNLSNQIDYNPLNKQAGEAQNTEDPDTKQLPWTITVNGQGLKNMKNTTITDTINNPAIMSYAGNGIRIEKFQVNSDGSETSQGVVTLSWSELGVDPESDHSWSYKITDDGNFKYVISYITEVDVSGQNGYTGVGNSVHDDDNHYSGGWRNVPPGSSRIGVDKQVGTVTKDKMSWTITMDVPAKGLTKAIMVDELPHSGSYQDTLNVESLHVQGLEQGDSYVLTQSKGKFTLTFYKDAEHTVAGLNGTGRARQIVVTFDTDNDPLWIATNREDEHWNKVSFQGNNSTVWDQDKGKLPHTGLEKTGYGYREITIDDADKAIVFEYTIDLYGVTDEDLENGLVITDEYDKDYLEFLNIDDGRRYNGIDTWWAQQFQNGYCSCQHDGIPKIVPIEENGILTFTVHKSDLPLNSGELFPRYQIRYYLVVKDSSALLNASLAESDRTLTLRNKATWGDSTDEVGIDYSYNGLIKTNIAPSISSDPYTTFDRENGVTGFRIEINPAKLQLNDGNPMTLEDVFTGNLSVVYSSINITCDPEPDTPVTYDYRGNTGTFTIPDSTHVIIKYDAKVIGKPNEWVSYGNTVNMKGFSDSSSGNAWINGTGDASLNIYSVKLFKYSAGHMEQGLEGATFTLVDENGSPITYPSFAKNGMPNQPITFTTDENGYVNIKLNEDQDGLSLQKGITYYLKETASPASHAINNTIYRFTISDMPDYTKYEYHSGDIVKVYNWPITGRIEIFKSIVGAQQNLTQEDKQKITFEITGTYSNGTPIKVDSWGYGIEESDLSKYTAEELASFHNFKINVSYADFTFPSDGSTPKYVMADLVDGIYTVKETSYLLPGFESVTVSSTTYQVNTDGTRVNDDQTAGQEQASVTITNHSKYAVNYTNTYTKKDGHFDLTVKKVHKDGLGDIPLYGAVFKLEKRNDADGSYSLVTADVGSVNTDGTFSIPYENRETGVTLNSLAPGAYRITEIAAPANYKISGDGVIEFTIDAQGNVSTNRADASISYTQDETHNTAGTYTVNNDLKHSYTITKADSASISLKLPGAEFTVYASHYPDTTNIQDAMNEDKTVPGNPIFTYTTDADGRFEIQKNDFDGGYQANKFYYIMETKAPEGYEIPSGQVIRYFYFGYDGEVPTAMKPVNLGELSKSETITNDLKDLKVTKLWKNLKGDNLNKQDIDVDTVDFVVYQKATVKAADGTVISESAETRFPDDNTAYTIEYSGGNWQTVTIPNAPSLGKDKDGNVIHYSYRVEEDVPDGWVVDIMKSDEGRTFTMTNKPVPMQITVRKKWDAPEAMALKDPQNDYVNIQIFQDGSEIPIVYQNVNTFKLNRANNFEMTIEVEAGSTYTIKEKDYKFGTKNSGFKVSFEVNGVPSTDSSIDEEGTIEITNTYDEPYLEIKKVWANSDEDNSNKYIRVDIYRRNITDNGSWGLWKKDVSLDGRNQPGWSRAFIGEEELETEGKEYEYYVIESQAGVQWKNSIDDYSVVYSATKDQPLIRYGIITITNYDKEFYDGHLTVNKQWKTSMGDDLSEDSIPNNVRLALQRAEGVPVGNTVTLNVLLTNGETKSKSITVPGGSTVTFEMLGSFTYNCGWSGESFSFSDPVYNTGPNNNETKYQLVVPNVMNNITINVQQSGGESWNTIHSLSIVEDFPQSYELKTEFADVEGAVVVLTKPNWSYTWSNLETHSNDGMLYVYNVREVSIDGKTPQKAGFISVVDNANGTNDGTVTLTNRELAKGSLKIIKHVTVNGQSITGTKADGTYTFRIDDSSGKKVKSVSITIENGVSNTVEVDNLDEGTYTVTEISSTNPGVTIDLTPKTVTVTGGKSGDQVLSSGIVEVTNDRSASGTVPFKAKKTLQDGTLQAGQFTFTLTEYTNEEFKTMKEDGASQTSTNNAAGDVLFEDISYTILQAGEDAEHPNYYYYLIKEEKGTDPEVRYDETEYKIKVAVYDKGDGTLSVTKTVVAPIGSDAPTVPVGYDASFTNEQIHKVPLRIFKVDMAAQTTPLSGAEFTLTRLDEDEPATDTGGTKKLKDGVSPIDPLPTGADGTVLFENLEYGWYEVKETGHPTGYVLTSDATFYIKINAEGVHLLDANENAPKTWNTKPVPFGNVLDFTAEQKTTPATIKVGNVSGTELPHSGGPGTALYGLLGGLMVVTAGAALTLRKKKNKA